MISIMLSSLPWRGLMLEMKQTLNVRQYTAGRVLLIVMLLLVTLLY